MKNKKVLIISLICIFLIVGIGGFFFYQNYQEKAKIKAETARQKENYERLVNNTKKDFSPYLENISLSIEGNVANTFNQVIKENIKNKNLNYEEFLTKNLKNINLTKLDSLLAIIDQELQDYSLDNTNLTLDNIINELDLSYYDKETVIAIFNNHEFFQNLDESCEKRNLYLVNLQNLKQDLIKINDQKNLFYYKDNKYLAKNTTVVNNIQGFSDKYHLNINVEKEFLVPILCYHGVLDNPWGISSLFVRVNEFETQMKYLSENGYTPLFVSEISTAKNYEKPIIITFDDGYLDVYTNAFPILKKYNMKANIYMISAWINGEVYMTTDMTKEMNASPFIEVGSHTVDHKSLAYLTNEQIEQELKQSKEDLESMLNTKIKVLAYPKGSYDNRVINIAKKYYDYALSTNNGMENPEYLNKYTLNRIYVYRGTNLTEFKKLL